MKKYFLFLLLLFPWQVSAQSILDLEVLNGTLSRKFETNNNIYSVILDEGEEKLLLNYTLNDSSSQAQIFQEEYAEGKENVATLEVTNQDGSKEIYTFYLEKEEEAMVFSPQKEEFDEEKEIPHLKYYVGGVCLLLILFFYKVIVIGFPKKK